MVRHPPKIYLRIMSTLLANGSTVLLKETQNQRLTDHMEHEELKL